MKRHEFTGGVILHVSGDIVVDEIVVSAVPIPPQRRGARQLAGRVPMPGNGSRAFNSAEPVLDPLKDSGFSLFKELSLESQSRPEDKRAAPSERGRAHFDVDLDAKEGVVLLLEQEGMYVWHFPEESELGKGAAKRSIENFSQRNTAHFEVRLAVGPSGASTRGLAGDVSSFIWGKVKAYILKFAAEHTVEAARDWLEKDTSQGIVHFGGVSTDDWKIIPDLTALKLPSDRKPKVLLFVHGTFSSSVGAFGQFSGTPWGNELLRSALNDYDAVIGFNHLTLKEDPLENAEKLLTILKGYQWVKDPVFDVIAHSRGGLVIRSLIEKLLPGIKWKAQFNKIIFVACTNEGTLLAEPQNWKDLINLYTNIIVGTSRVVGAIMPQTKVATLVLNDVIKSIGSFVQYCATAAVTDNLIRGLAAMEPSGKFVKDINEIQDGQPAIADSYYLAITSSFKPKLTGNHEPKELPKRFLELLAGGFMGQLMHETNDLVVNVSSMTAVDKSVGDYIKEKFDFGDNPQVYHTNYFVRPEVANAITRWLNLSAPPLVATTSSNAKRTTPKKAAKKAKTVTFKIGNQTIAINKVNFKQFISPKIDVDIISFDAGKKARYLKHQISKKAPSYVVVRRQHAGHTENFAFTGEEAAGIVAAAGNDSVFEAFKLQHFGASGSQDLSGNVIQKAAPNVSGSSARQVVLRNDKPLGVLPEPSEPPNLDALVAMVSAIRSPKGIGDEINRRRALPSFSFKQGKKTGSGSGGPPPGVSVSPPETENHKIYPESKVECHFLAEMPGEIMVNRQATLVVSVSREQLDYMVSVGTAETKTELEPNELINIRVIARKGLAVSDENGGFGEMKVPGKGLEEPLLFDIKAGTETGEAELWIVVRQKQENVAKLVLKPMIIAAGRPAVGLVKAEKRVTAPQNVPNSLNRLWIHEYRIGEAYFYKFLFYSESLGINFSKDTHPVDADRAAYVTSLYQKIEDAWVTSNKDQKKFTLQLRAFGAQLFSDLMPDGLQKLLWDNRESLKSIQVISEEPFIPWELVHLKDPANAGMPAETWFLGEMGVIRWLDGAGETGFPPKEIRIRNGKVKYVIPDYPHPHYELKQSVAEKSYLASKFGAQAVTPESGAVCDLISSPGQFDLLHFACHGGADLTDINDSKLLMQGEVVGDDYQLDDFTSSIVDTFANLKSEDNTPMVVLNACQAGRVGYKLKGIGGFAKAFLFGGAGAFIGSLWSVGDEPAREFTEALYDALDKGDTLVEATKAARKAAKNGNDATWLAYVVYGHPNLKIRRQ